MQLASATAPSPVRQPQQQPTQSKDTLGNMNGNGHHQRYNHTTSGDGDDDGDDDKNKLTKKKSRRNKQRNNDPWLPRRFVCKDPPGGKSDAVEYGLVVSMGVLFLYFLGCFATMISLPEPPIPTFRQSNFNPAMLIRRSRSTLEAFSSSSSRAGAVKNAADGLVQKQSPNQSAAAGAVPVPAIVTTAVVPESKWPVTLRNETDETCFDTIIHPGDLATPMKVPKFWSVPIHQNGLMSRDVAMKVGSCIDPTKHGDACPAHQRTIFVGIASYRDFQCRLTVESIFTRAKYPERIRVAIVDQIVNGEDPLCNEPMKPCVDDPQQALCKYIQQVDVYEMAAELSIGPVFARHIGYRMYRGEYYATQSDAHVSYTTGWDVDIILQMESTHNEMAVLSTYLTDVQGSISPKGDSLRNTRPIMCNTDYEGGPQGLHLRHGSQPERMPAIHNVPQLQPWWAAGYSFSRGHFIVNVPYDWLQPMIFQGEEMSIGIRGFTVGYDFYAPERSVCFHHYAVGKNAAVRNKVHHFWDNEDKYAGTGKAAMARLLGLVHMNPEVPTTSWDHAEEAMYGTGGVRTPEKFYETFGIDVKKKTVEGNLCSFVHEGGKMHKLFTPFLRPDGMGIDYGRISYRFVDPAKK